MISTLPRPRYESIPLNLYRVSRPGIATVLSNDRITPPGYDDVRHIVLDLSGLDYRFLEGQSLGVLPPGIDERGRHHHLRLYSIATSRQGDDGRGVTASVCVKRVHYTDPVTGQPRDGVASNYLCDLAPGDKVAVTGPAGKMLLLPDDPTANLILVATGTGIAPFRGFLQRIYRERTDWTGAVFLYFGVRFADECHYREEIESYLDRPGYRRSYAFSREQTAPDGRRLYVQHRMAEELDILRDLLRRDNTYLYICGLKGMEDGIEAVLEDQDHPEGWLKGTFQTLRSLGRILIETY
jgi:ferredoxin--NADP+ reductase